MIELTLSVTLAGVFVAADVFAFAFAVGASFVAVLRVIACAAGTIVAIVLGIVLAALVVIGVAGGLIGIAVFLLLVAVCSGLYWLERNARIGKP